MKLTIFETIVSVSRVAQRPFRYLADKTNNEPSLSNSINETFISGFLMFQTNTASFVKLAFLPINNQYCVRSCIPFVILVHFICTTFLSEKQLTLCSTTGHYTYNKHNLQTTDINGCSHFEVTNGAPNEQLASNHLGPS